MDGWMDGWMAGWLGGWVDGWMGELVNGWMDERTNSDASPSHEEIHSHNRLLSVHEHMSRHSLSLSHHHYTTKEWWTNHKGETSKCVCVCWGGRYLISIIKTRYP